ncbi:MAG TPA: DUF2169 domain-containing protein [Candidatus Nanopelagicales bacterium]|nr:DUF2169 domain-containing protein [Candidatus Nanopelagicales bacterium]
MDVVSLGTASITDPLPVASLLWQPRPDAWMLAFACKATFTLRPVQSPLAPQQEGMYDAERHWSDDPTWSIYAPADIVPIRPRPDIVLVGEAYAPGGQPARSLVARLVVGEVDKAIEVYADRWFTQDGALQEGTRFTRMPLLWERAGGGPETSNPVGVADERDAYGRRALPNLQPPGVLVDMPDAVIEPVGFGPIASSWPSRRRRLGRYAGTWSDHEWTRAPLPADFDATYFNVAPRDQQPSQLRDDERLILDNLHPEHPHLVTNLSGHHPRAFVARPGRLPQAVGLRAELLWIDTARGLCTLTWRGQVPLEHAHEEGQVLVALEEPGQSLNWSDLERLLAERGSDVEGAPNSEDVIRTLPPRAPSVTTTAELSDEDVEEEEERLATGTMEAPLQPRSGGAVLPFAGAPPAPPPPPPPSAVVPPPMVIAPASVAMPPGMVEPPPLAPPPLVRHPQPRTIGEAAIEAAPPIAGAAAAGAIGGAIGASDAAAAASAPFTLPREERRVGAAAGPAVRAAGTPSAADREIVHLVWFDAGSVPRLRRYAPWRALLKELQNQPPDKDLDDPALGDEPGAVEDRREVFEIVARASATDAEGLREALEGAERDDGKFVPPVRLFAGELVLPFGELETLKATIGVVTPMMGADENLRASVAHAQELLKVPELGSAPVVAEGLTTRIREAWAQGKRAVPQSYLDTQVERALLEQRAYQRRKVLGGKHLRGLLTPSGSEERVPVYLPEALAEGLPQYGRFKVRVVGEIHVQVDQYESHPAALRGVALGRVTASMRRR